MYVKRVEEGVMMNESVNEDLKNICTANEFDAMLKIIEIIESNPERKQKDLIEKVIKEVSL